MSQKTETVVILGHQQQISYEQLDERFSLDLVLELLDMNVLRALVNKELRAQELAKLKALANPPVKQKRLLAFNRLTPAQLEELQEQPGLFESVINRKITDMETKNEFIRILDPATTGSARSATTEKTSTETDPGAKDSPAQ